MSRGLTVCYCGGVDHRAVIVLPCDGILVDGAVEGRGVFRVTGNSNDLRSPACEGVGILIGCVLSRVGVSRGLAICYGGGVDHTAVIVLPCDGILVDGAVEGSGVFRVAGHSCDLRSPACEGVGILIGRVLSSVRMSRNLAVSNSGGVDHSAVIVLPCDGILVDGAVEGSGVFRVAGHSCDLRSPAYEGVGIVFVRRLSRVGMSRSIAVNNGGGVDHGTVVILPCDGELGDVHCLDAVLVPLFAAVTVRTEVDIIGAVGSDLIVVACAVGIPCPITRFILDDLDSIVRSKCNAIEHILVALSLGIRCKQIVVVDLPLGHSADNIVTCLMLRGALECRDIGCVAVYDRQLIGCVEVRTGCPTDEVIGKVVVFVLSRSFAVIGRKCAGL